MSPDDHEGSATISTMSVLFLEGGWVRWLATGLAGSLALWGCGDDVATGGGGTGAAGGGGAAAGGEAQGGDGQGGQAQGGQAQGGQAQGGAGGDGGAGGSCAAITDDPSNIGDECSENLPCPEPYTCQGVAGVVFQQRCAILCAMDCECPSGTSCEELMDKAGSWMECVFLPD